MPGIAEMPARLWRKLGRGGRAALAFLRRVAVPSAQSGARARARLDEALSHAILIDSRRRARTGGFPRPGKRVQCESPPGASEGSGRIRHFSCVAVTAELAESETNAGVISGIPYRARADLASGQYAFCKVSGQADLARKPLVPTPKSVRRRVKPARVTSGARDPS